MCVFPNKDQTSVQTVPINPAKSDGKKGNICPSPVSDINTADDDPDMWCKLLLYNSIKQVLRQLARGRSGVFTTTGHFQIQTEIENQGVEAAKLAGSVQHLSCGATACERPGLHAGARVLV